MNAGMLTEGGGVGTKNERIVGQFIPFNLVPINLKAGFNIVVII